MYKLLHVSKCLADHLSSCDLHSRGIQKWTYAQRPCPHTNGGVCSEVPHTHFWFSFWVGYHARLVPEGRVIARVPIKVIL